MGLIRMFCKPFAHQWVSLACTSSLDGRSLRRERVHACCYQEDSIWHNYPSHVHRILSPLLVLPCSALLLMHFCWWGTLFHTIACEGSVCSTACFWKAFYFDCKAYSPTFVPVAAVGIGLGHKLFTVSGRVGFCILILNKTRKFLIL